MTAETGPHGSGPGGQPDDTAPAADAQATAGCPFTHDELTASPWLGLHYKTAGH